MGFLAAALPLIAADADAASTIATVGAAASLVGGAVSALGSVETASAQEKAAQYQAQVAANNQKLATQNAAQAEAAGSTAVEQQGLKTKAEVGAIKAAQAASNIDVNQGSAVDVRSSAAELGELDALTIRSNAEKQAYGYQTQAQSFAGQEALAKSQAAQAPIAGAIGAFGSILSGASGAAGQYLNWQRAAGGDTWNPEVLGEGPAQSAYSQGGPSSGVYGEPLAVFP